MPIPILMPALSPTMEDGTLAKWYVKEGDEVTSGDVIAEIETDKATMEVEAVDEGTVGKILIVEGTEGVAVNAPIAVLLEEGEDSGALQAFNAEGAKHATPTAAATIIETTSDQPVESKEASVEVVEQSTQTASLNGQGGRILASPLARRIAKDNEVDIAVVSGSGPHGRVVKRDIERAVKEGVQADTGRAVVAPGAGDQSKAGPSLPIGMSDDQIMALYDSGSYEVVPHDNMRKTIARRLVESKITIPHFYLSIECELDALLAARRRMNDIAPQEGPKTYKLSVNDFIIKAMAMALQQVPHANATWTEQGILRHRSSDVGVAVAVDGGLFTPVLRHAELKSLSEISNEMKDLAERARNRRLAPHEYQGGTTSISNLGMFGIKRFDAVINPPHATILAVGVGERRPVVKGDAVQIANIMSVTLSCDHRVVDGALGAELLGAFKRFIEEPVSMLV